MKTFLCVVSPKFPENYHIGVQARRWGVQKKYKEKIAKTAPGDELVFLVNGRIRSIHRIESAVFRDETPLWPPKDDDLFPFRIEISLPLFVGEIPNEDFVQRIGFMREAQAWAGTIMGANGVFNEKLKEEDVAFIKSRMRQIPQREVEAARAAEQPEIKNLFRIIGSDVLESLKRILPALGLARYNGSDFPAEYDLGYGGNVILCRDFQKGDLVVVDFNRGEAPTQTLIRVLHYMSWARQTLAGTKDVRGIILTEAANEALAAIVKEVPIVALRFYRIGIELLEENRASA